MHPSARFAAVRSALDALSRDIRYALRLLRRTPLFTLTIFGLLALAAALLAGAGIYGLIAASMSERTRELGIRLALGATRWQAIVSVARPGLGLSVAGVLIGCVGAYALSGGLRHLVWGISVTDPATFVAVAGAALALAAAASLGPALRVRHLDPAQTLRRD